MTHIVRLHILEGGLTAALNLDHIGAGTVDEQVIEHHAEYAALDEANRLVRGVDDVTVFHVNVRVDRFIDPTKTGI